VNDSEQHSESPFVHGTWDYFELSRQLKERNEGFASLLSFSFAFVCVIENEH